MLTPENLKISCACWGSAVVMSAATSLACPPKFLPNDFEHCLVLGFHEPRGGQLREPNAELHDWIATYKSRSPRAHNESLLFESNGDSVDKSLCRPMFDDMFNGQYIFADHPIIRSGETTYGPQ